ncbi:MAG: autotransporter domain-containing protein [Rhodospirillaceae bacterium]|nr:autotransporter domain-containing protein [Rhodospirillaceae bacterium]
MTDAHAAASTCDAVSGNLVLNCGFEASGSWSGTGFQAINGAQGTWDQHSGSYFNVSGNVLGSRALLQTISTVAGATYSISFYATNVSDPTATIAATFDGTSILTAATPHPGQTFPSGTSVVANNSGNYIQYTGTAVASGTSSVLEFLTITGGSGKYILLDDIVIILMSLPQGSSYQQRGASSGPVGSIMGAALDRISTSSSAQAGLFQTDVLGIINALPTAQQGRAIKQLAPTQNVPSSQMSSAAATAVLGAVEQHQQIAMAYSPGSRVATGSESHDRALWGQVLGGGARRGSTADADGYTLGSFGLAAGLDHRFTPSIMGGAALSWVRTWSQGRDDSTGSSSILDSYQLTFYGTYRIDRAFVDGQLGVGWNEFDQKRAIPFLGTTAAAQYSGQQYLAKATVGYDVPVAGNVTVTPLASLRWLRSVTDSYDETRAGAANLSVDRRGVNSLSQDLGGKVSWSLPTDFGILKPEMRLAWVHDYTRGPIATSGLIGGESFAVSVPRSSANGARIGLAASLSGNDSVSFRFDYEGELRTRYQSHTGLVKAVWGF